MAQLKISLSRAHKIAERLKTQIADLQKNALDKSANLSVNGFSGSAQVERIAQNGVTAMADLDAARVLGGALAHVRACIAKANEERGINKLLASIDVLNKEAAILKGMLANAESNALPLAELESYKPLKAESFLSSLQVQVMSAEQRDQLKARTAEVGKKLIALSDSVAEANAAFFVLELDDKIAAEVTAS